MRVAIISDIHGNRLALEAVLDDIARQGVDLVVNLGDNLAGPMDPAGVARILRDLALPSVRGNHDRYLIEDGPLGRVDSFVLGELGSGDIGWLGSLPTEQVIAPDLFLCHGTPRSDSIFWLEGSFEGRSSIMPTEKDIASHADGIEFPLMACGHSHRPRLVRLTDGRLIINPGSVGLQFVHGSPEARYALIEGSGRDWSVNLRAIGYDYEGAAAQAERNGFGQWREALTTGWSGPEGLF